MATSRQWAKRRLSDLPKDLSLLEEAKYEERLKRRKFLGKILDQKGFSVHDWAKEADVDFHTANDYLYGRTRPHPSTLKKLADALGVKVAKLLNLERPFS